MRESTLARLGRVPASRPGEGASGPGRRRVRIAGAGGFWGDDLDAPVRQVEGGPINYLVMDYLAEVTMSILHKQRARDPNMGYARDFVALMERILPTCLERGVRVVANAGGVNPRGCAGEVARAAARAGVRERVRLGVVTGDDLMPRLDELLRDGHELRNMETGEPLANIRDRVTGANVYLGAFPIAEALGRGADVVVTGRCVDAALTLAPLLHEFGWAPDDHDRLAAGVVAGHVNECGAQCTGGNAMAEWWSIPDLDRVGFPIIEAEPSGAFVVTKHEGSGGRVSPATVTEQIVYEIGDPAAYPTPDVVADFTSVRLGGAGRDRVRVTGARGRPPTGWLKASIVYSAGWRAVGTLVYAWPDAAAKARAAARVLRARLDRLGLNFDEVRTDLVGWDSTHGTLAGPPPRDLPEVQLRVAVRGGRGPVERFTREIAPLVLTGPPSVTGFGEGRPRVSEVAAFWPALVARDAVEPLVRVEIQEA